MPESFWSICKTKLVPDISDSLIELMAAQIKPVAEVGRGRFREIDIAGVDRRNVAFTWEPKWGRFVRLYNGSLNSRDVVTFHSYGFHGFFKPSLAEVYACINQFVPDWSSVRYFRMKSDDMDRHNIVEPYHWCRCQLFGEEEWDVNDQNWERDVAELAAGKEE
jgi:hypothetical protein